MMLRFSLKQLLALVAFAAVTSASLAQPGYWWHATIVTAVACLAIGMLIAALVSEPHRRTFAVGWLVLAVGYLAIIFGPWTSTNIAPQLLTSSALARLESKWHGSAPSPPLFQPVIVDYNGDGLTDLWVTNPSFLYGQSLGGSGTVLWNVNTGRAVPQTVPEVSSHYSVFQATAHWLVAVVLGQLGGWLTLALARHRTSGTVNPR